MPGLITNYLFGERAYQSLSPNYLKDIIRKYPNAYRIGLQGPDIFFYYLSYYMRTRKNNIYTVLHKKNTGMFLDNMIEYAVILEPEESEVCLAYISGFLCHYALDIHTHPYFRYRVEQDFLEHHERQSIPFYYRRIETLMDTLLLKRLNHMEPSQLNLEALVSASKKERKLISDCLVYALRTTYHYRISRKTVLKVLHSVRSTCNFLQTNPLLRQQLLRVIDDRLPFTPSKICFMYPDYEGDPEDYLNEMKQTWFKGKERIECNDSFYDLLSDASVFSNQMLEALDDYLAWHGSREHLNQVIGSRSYFTGDHC